MTDDQNRAGNETCVKTIDVMYRPETNCQFIYEYCLFVLIFISMLYVLCEAIYRCLNFHGDTGDQYINGDSTIFDVTAEQIKFQYFMNNILKKIDQK